MAAAGSKTKPNAKRSVPSGNGNPPPLHMDVVSVRQEIGEEIMGWVACCVLIALLLPMGGMLYWDILETKHEAKRALQKLEKIEQRIERKERDKNRKEPDSFSDNPVFDRVRRPFSLQVPRPTELGTRRL